MTHKTLRIVTTKQQVFFGDQLLSLPSKWVAFLAYLGLAATSPEVTNLTRSRDGHIYVGSDDVAELEGFGPNDIPHRKTLRRFVRDELTKRLGRQLILSPHGATEKQFRLDLEMVSVEFDVAASEVARWLNLNVTIRKVSNRDYGLQIADLALIEALIEAHQFDRAEVRLETLHHSEPEDELLIRMMLAWSFLRERQHRLAEAVDFHQRAKDLLIALDTAELEPLFELQAARLARADEDFATAEKTVRRGLNVVSLENAFLVGRLETLAGLLVLDRGQFEPLRAEASFTRALELFAGIHWWWGVQASCANIALMWWRQLEFYKLPSSERPLVAPVLRDRWLLQANTWFARADECCSLTGLRHESPDLLIYLAKTERLLGKHEDALMTLDRAELLAVNWRSDRDRIEAMFERGEVEWSRGHLEEARQHWTNLLDGDLEVHLRDHITTRIGRRLEVLA
jgi:tetratricopeptide (TPR) repeat protein